MHVHIVTLSTATVRTVWTYEVEDDTFIPPDATVESVEEMQSNFATWVAIDFEEEVVDYDESEVTAWDCDEADIDVEVDS